MGDRTDVSTEPHEEAAAVPSQDGSVCPQCTCVIADANLFRLHVLGHLLTVNTAADSPAVSQPPTLTTQPSPDSPYQQLSGAEGLARSRCPLCTFVTEDQDLLQKHFMLHQLILKVSSAQSTSSKQSNNGSNGFTTDNINYNFLQYLGNNFIHTLNDGSNPKDNSSLLPGNGDGSSRCESDVDFSSLTNTIFSQNSDNMNSRNACNNRLYCPICRFWSPDNYQFEQHLLTHTSEDGRLCCDKCNFVSSSLQDIKVRNALSVDHTLKLYTFLDF